MTLPYLIETVIELILIILCMTILVMARRNTEHKPITTRFSRVRKFLGYAITLLIGVSILNYTYTVYRYINPSKPSDITIYAR